MIHDFEVLLSFNKNDVRLLNVSLHCALSVLTAAKVLRTTLMSLDKCNLCVVSFCYQAFVVFCYYLLHLNEYALYRNIHLSNK